MDFNDTPEEAAFREKARTWLDANAEPLKPGEFSAGPLDERDDAASIQSAKDWQKKKAEGGWACLTWPKEYGGQGASSIQNVIWNQEEARYKTPPNIYGIGLGMCGPTIMTHGTDAQRDRWLPEMRMGQKVWCQLFSEPSAGSDLAGLRSTAVRDGNDWVIYGQKIWTTGAHFCDWGILVVRSDATVAKHSGLTYFVVDMHSPGIEIRPITQINGGRGFNEVFFTDVRIPDDQRISEIGNGWAVAITTLMNERASIGGGGGSSVHDLMDLARNIEVDGKTALDQSAVREKIATFYTRTKGLKLTGYRTLSAISQGKTPGPESSLGKLVGGRLTQEMSAFAMDLQGSAAALNDPGQSPQSAEWQDRYLSIPGLRIAGGTDEILRNIISERVLGLPPESRADKGIAFKDIPTGPPSN